MAELSPAAQAVLDALVDAACGSTYEMQHGVAAAIRAVADQVVPVISARTAAAAGKRRARADLLAIAAELEGAG